MDELLQRFRSTGLPPAQREVSEKFHDLARDLAGSLPVCTERAGALRRLLEARDCAVRAAAQLPASPEKKGSKK